MSAVVGTLLAGKFITDAHGDDDRPFDYPDRTGHAQAGQEADTLVLDVTEDGEVYPGTPGLVPACALITVAVGPAC